jgi:N-acetylneuraminic acid mutarotase
VNKIIALLLAFILLASASSIIIKQASSDEATGDSWATMASMSTARTGLGVAAVDGKMYAVGGRMGSERTGANEMYDTTADTWTNKTQMLTPRSSFAIAAYKNRIYCIGGDDEETATDVNECYDTATGSWTKKTPLPTPMADMTANVVNERIYVIGGNYTFAYDPEADSWIERTPPPVAVRGHASAVVDNKIYVIGGEEICAEHTFLSRGNLNQIYSPETDTWSNGTSAPKSVVLAAGAETSGVYAARRIYVMGGGYYVIASPDWYFTTNLNLIFDPETGNWSEGARVPSVIYGFGVAVVDDLLYVVGGSQSGTALTSNERYTPVGYEYVPPTRPEPFPETLIVGAVVAATVVGLSLLLYFRKRKK